MNTGVLVSRCLNIMVASSGPGALYTMWRTKSWTNSAEMSLSALIWRLYTYTPRHYWLYLPLYLSTTPERSSYIFPWGNKIFFQLLLCMRHHSKHYFCSISFKHHSSPLRWLFEGDIINPLFIVSALLCSLYKVTESYRLNVSPQILVEAPTPQCERIVIWGHETVVLMMGLVLYREKH